MMVPQPDPIRRHPDGSIEFGFYGRRAAVLRANAQRDTALRALQAPRSIARLVRRAIESILLFSVRKA